MSDIVQDRIAQAEQCLRQRIANAESELATDIPNMNYQEFLTWTAQVNMLIELLGRSMEQVRAYDNEWLSILSQLSGQERETERDGYKAAATAQGGYLALIQETEVVISQLIARIRSVDTAQYQAGGVHNMARNSNSLTNEPKCSHIRTPKLEMPFFHGNILEWPGFWSVFRAAVHDRTDLTKTEKMTYLFGQLKGKARDGVDGMLVNDYAYDSMLAILKGRYDRSGSRRLPMLYGELKNLPACSKGGDAVRVIYDKCEKIFRMMIQAGEDVDNSRVLTMDYLSKFPQNVVRSLRIQHNVTPECELGTVRQAMEQLISTWEDENSVLSNLAALRVSRDERGNSQAQASRPPSAVYNSETRTSALAAVAETPPSSCYLCSGPHFNGDCDQYKTARQRIQRLRELNRCTRCAVNHARGYGPCRRPIRCVHCRTQNQHYSALCFKKFPDIQTPIREGAAQANANAAIGAEDTNEEDITAITTEGLRKRRSPLFQTARANVLNSDNGRKVSLRLCLDTLSSRSYISDGAAAALALPLRAAEKLHVSVFGLQKQISVPTRLVRFEVEQRDGSFKEVEANTAPVISCSGVLPRSWPEKEWEEIARYQKTGKLADDPRDEDSKIDVLIGQDYAWDFIVGAKVTLVEGVFVIPTTLGDMLAGTVSSDEKCDQQLLTMFCQAEHSLHHPKELAMPTGELSVVAAAMKDVDEYWRIEGVGIEADSQDEEILGKFQETIVFDGDRYVVGWPWMVEKKLLLPSNYGLAKRRFASLGKRLQSGKDKGLFEGYRDVIRTQREKGIIERVGPLKEALKEGHLVHYLPHHPVLKPSSETTKIRVVYDGSAKQNKDDVSLNECMFRGPVMLPDLCQILLRFRTHAIAVVADIEKAFLQVGLRSEDRDVTRFLWLENDSSPDFKDSNIAVYRFTRVLFGIISSMFLLAATVLHHLNAEAERSDTARMLKDDIYVDNTISGLASEDQLEDYYREAKAIFERSGMNLQQFCSNAGNFVSLIPEWDRAKSTDIKVLGIKWDSQKDDTLRIPEPFKWLDNKGETVTKRKILSAIASLFDPLGWYQPVSFPVKLLLQEIWSRGFEWDEKLPEEIANHWFELRDQIRPVFEFRIPRYIGETRKDQMIVVFTDASTKGYGAVAYLWTKRADGSRAVNLLMAKSRLAPMQMAKKKRHRIRNVTIPRLELMGAVTGVNLGSFCRDGLRVADTRIHFFIDSTIVLHWLRSQDLSNLKRFVSSRVEVLRKVINCEFHYVRSQDNPADYVTRGKTANELINDPCWWSGPEWLQLDVDEWPEEQSDGISDERLREIEQERKGSSVIQSLPAVTGVEKGVLGLKIHDFSSMSRLLRLSATILIGLKRLVVSKLPNPQGRFITVTFGDVSSCLPVQSSDYEAALSVWVAWVQHQHYENIFEAVSNRKKCDLVHQLGLRIGDDGLIRSHSRYDHADLKQITKAPLLIPPNSNFTELLVMDIHVKMGHAGENMVLNELRQRFWIPRGRTVVKGLRKRCLTCKLYHSRVSFGLPDMPPWPRERVARSKPFENVGLDYLGPVKVRVGDEIRKMWVCLFSCLCTRAIHLEPVCDCTAEEFLNCLIRFFARRCFPKLIISDNAAQFKLVEILGRLAWKRIPTDPSVLRYSAEHGVRWKFITELAPWQGGHYERLVGVVKSVLRPIIGRRFLYWSDFVTLVVETESIVNCRPITYVGSDRDGPEVALRPVDFINPSAANIPVNQDSFETRNLSASGKRLAGLWRQRKRQLDRLWERWYDEYLLSLRNRGGGKHRQARAVFNRSPRLGEVVVIRSENVPRGSWKLGKVTKVIVSEDSKVRSVELRLGNGETIRRSVAFLYPLEVDEDENDVIPEPGDPESPAATVEDPSVSDERTASASGKRERTELKRSPEPDEDLDFLGFSAEDIANTLDQLDRFDF